MDTNSVQTVSGKPLLLRVEKSASETREWIRERKQEIDGFLSGNGALLIRGLTITDPGEFGSILRDLFGGELASYTYRSTPRTELKEHVYTATEYHHTEAIPQHNENSYSRSWPMRIGFLCTVPPGKMGNTPISDSRAAFHEIPREIREEFQRKKVMYVRNYSNIDLHWSEVFQTRDKRAVEQYCDAHDIAFEWTAGEGLRTRQTNQATIEHPLTGEDLWFNQAHLFHVSSLKEELQEDLISLVGEENLPRNCCFGDGTPIDVAMLDEIRSVYDRTKFSFSWQQNDLLLLDNMLFTHGREPFEGPRQVLVGMAREYRP